MKKLSYLLVFIFALLLSVVTVNAAVLTIDVNGGQELEQNKFEFKEGSKLSDILSDNNIDNTLIKHESKILDGFINGLDGSKYTGEEEFDEDKTIYANWVEPKIEVTKSNNLTFYVNFELNGGTCENCEKQTINEGDLAVKPTNPIKENYDFVSWYTDPEFNNEFSFETQIVNNYTLYAKYELKKIASLEVDVNIVDFGIVNVGFKNNIEKNITLRNSGNVDLTIDMTSPSSIGPFDSVDFDATHVIKPNEEYTIKLIVKTDGINANKEGTYEGDYSFAGTSADNVTITKIVKAKVKINLPSVNIAYTTHVQNVGWQGYVYNGLMAGTQGRSLRLEAIKIKLENAPYSGNVEYRTHIQNIGWESGYRIDNQISGTSGRSFRLEAIEIRLTGEMSRYYDVYYRVHAQNYGWLGWAKNGEQAGTSGYSYRLEGIEIKIYKKGEKPFGYGTQAVFYDKLEGAVIPVNDDKQVAYTTHVQNIGWQDYRTDGQMSGTQGQSLRLEGIKIKLVNQKYPGDIEYRTHIQNVGWETSFKRNYEMSGTSGRSLRLEAIEIKLTGEMSEYYDVYYRVHAQNFGWLGWAKNGERAGTAGYGYRLEGIEIELVEKGKEFNKEGNRLIFIDSKTGGEVSRRANGQGWVTLDGKRYYYDENGVKATYLKKIGDVRYEFSKNGELQHSNIKLIADLSYHNGDIDFTTLWNSGEIDGIIFRVGYSRTVDAKFAEYISEAKRLGIPYSVYHFSYAENAAEAQLEAEHLVQWYQEYNLNPTMGVFYDIEGWTTKRSSSDYISISDYDAIIGTYQRILNEHGINMSLYTGKYYAETRLSDFGRSVISWIAHYANNCGYMGSYRGWQYTSTGQLPGISGNVDLSIFYY